MASESILKVNSSKNDSSMDFASKNNDEIQNNKTKQVVTEINSR